MKISDAINFLRKLNIYKLFNAAKVLGSFYIMRYTGKARQFGLPFTISVEPTTACNLRCPECPSGLRSFTRPTGNLKKDFFKRFIDDSYSHLIYLIFYFQGEPYINPDFLDMVRYASDKKIYTITSTNGHFLNDENAKKTVLSGLDRLIISVDGTTQETYEKYRKEGKLANVIAGTKNLLRWKKKLKSKSPHVIFQFLVVGHNEHQIEDLYDLAEELGVDEVKLKSAQIYNYHHGSDLMPQNTKYSRYIKTENGTYKLKYEVKDECWKMWHSSLITWDGKVVPCCFDKDATHIMGDLKVDNFEEIWKSQSYFNFRSQIIQGRDQIDICTNCSEGCKVFF